MLESSAPQWWSFYMSFIGVINPCIMLPQLVKLLWGKDARGVSLVTLYMITLVQGSFAFHGYFINDKLLVYTNSVAFIVSLATVAGYFYVCHNKQEV